MASIFNIDNLHIVQHNVRNYHTNKELLHSNWDEEDPDIILLNSTCMNPKYVYSAIKYKDYKVYNTPPGLHNGSAILIKRRLKHSRTNTGDEQLLAVTIGTTEGLITLSTFYRPFDESKTNRKIPHTLNIKA